MKTALKLLSVILVVMASATCRKYRPVESSSVSEVLHTKALAALEEGSFVIRSDEFYFPAPDQQIKPVRGGYLAMQGGNAVLKFPGDVFPLTSAPLNYMALNDEAATIEKEESLRIGERRFALTMGEGRYWMSRIIMITLHKNTDKCFVEIYNGHTMSMISSFAGHVLSAPSGKKAPAMVRRRRA